MWNPFRKRDKPSLASQHCPSCDALAVRVERIEALDAVRAAEWDEALQRLALLVKRVTARADRLREPHLPQNGAQREGLYDTLQRMGKR